MFYWTAVVLVVAAMVLHGEGWGQVDKAAHLKAVAIHRMSEQRTAYVPEPAAEEASHAARILYATGYGFAAASVICLLAAAWRKEGGYHLLVILFLMLDFTFSLIP